MKIAIVSGHFMPEIGYQETHLAKAFSRGGHEVCVFSTTAISPTGQKVIRQDYQSGQSRNKEYGFSVVRLKPAFRLNSKVMAMQLQDQVKKFAPDLIVILALAKLFPAPLLTKKFKAVAKVALFGDAAEYADKSTDVKRVTSSLQHFAARFTKGYLYNKAVENCSAIVLNLPETENYFKSLLSPGNTKLFSDKKVMLNLGYDPDTFFFDEASRVRLRDELNIPESSCVIITATRVHRAKKLENVIHAVTLLKSKGMDVHYILIGMHGDDYEKELRALIDQQPNPEIFHCFPFFDQEKLRAYYSSADIGLWTKAAISIQEAMGTGLPILLENKPSVNHLLKEGVTGWYYDSKQFDSKLTDACTTLLSTEVEERKSNRLRNVAVNSSVFSYDVIAKKITDTVS